MIDPFLHTRTEPWPAREDDLRWARACRRRCTVLLVGSILMTILITGLAALALVLLSSCSAITPAIPADRYEGEPGFDVRFRATVEGAEAGRWDALAPRP